MMYWLMNIDFAGGEAAAAPEALESTMAISMNQGMFSIVGLLAGALSTFFVGSQNVG